MPIVSDAHRLRRRQQILDAFVACAAREGFHRTTMAAVIDEAGLSAGAVYGYFKSKTEMIRAVVERNLGGATEQLHRLADQSDVMTPRLIVEAFVGSPLEDYGPESSRISVQVWAEAARDPDVSAMVADQLAQLRAALATLVAGCQANGTLSTTVDPQRVALALVSFLPGYLLQRLVFPDLSPDSFVEGALSLIGQAKD